MNTKCFHSMKTAPTTVYALKWCRSVRVICLYISLSNWIELLLTTTQQLWFYWTAPERGDGYIGNPLSNFYGSLTCPEDRLWYTGPPVNVPIRRTWLERSALPKDTACIPQWGRHWSSNPVPPDLQSSVLTTELPSPLLIENESSILQKQKNGHEVV